MQFVDLKEQYRAYRDEIMAEMGVVLESAAFINGPAIGELERELAEHTGVKHAIGCSSGTDALVLSLMAMRVKPGDEIIVPDFSFIATAEAVVLAGARPVFADVRPATYNLDPGAARAALTDRTVGIIPVSLYGQPADLDALNDLASAHDLWVMEDAAQSYGALSKGRRSGSLTTLAATSFFPAKPLGAYGDGGAVFTNDDEIAAAVRMLLNHGQRKRYDHAIVGMNARLDTLQAAILKVKLRHFDDEVVRRQEVADWYTRSLAGVVPTPIVEEHNRSVWAQYTVRVQNRDAVRSFLAEREIPTSVHYPIPLHRQDALREYRTESVDAPHAERAAAEVLSLPMHPFMSRDDAACVAQTLTEALESIRSGSTNG